jgi:chromosome segregation ATPase
VQRLRAEHTVLKQRRSRLDGQCDEHKKEIKELGGSVRTMHSHLQK